jgi:hypothetical protein
MTAASWSRSRRNDSRSMSAGSIWTFLPTAPLAVGSKSSSSGSTSAIAVVNRRVSQRGRQPSGAHRQRLPGGTERQTERLDGALEPLEQIDGHQLLDAALATGLSKVGHAPPTRLSPASTLPYRSSYLCSRLENT